MKLREFLPKVLIFLAIFSCYFINRSEEAKEIVRPIDALFAAGMSMTLLLYWLYSPPPISRFLYYVLLFLSSLFPLLFGGIFNIHFLYAIIFFEISLNQDYWSKRDLTFFLCAALFAVVVQLTMFEFVDGRRVMSIFDPNYTAYYIYLLGVIAYSLRRPYFSAVIFLIGFLTISRVYLIAVLVLYLLKYLNFALKRVNWKMGVVLMMAVPVMAATYFLSNFQGDAGAYDSSYSRFTNFADASNEHRALATVNYIDYIYENPIELIKGVDLERYTANVFMNTPHATIYQMFFNYGFFYVACLLGGLLIWHDSVTSSVRSKFFLLSLLVWTFFLGSVLFGPQMILLGLVFKEINTGERIK